MQRAVCHVPRRRSGLEAFELFSRAVVGCAGGNPVAVALGTCDEPRCHGAVVLFHNVAVVVRWIEGRRAKILEMNVAGKSRRGYRSRVVCAGPELVVLL